MSPQYSLTNFNGLEVAYLPELDGGGAEFGLDYLPVVEHLFPHVGRLFEFCAGPGFIGFALLAEGRADELVLADVNPAAVAAARETVRRNGLEGRVTVYESDGLRDIPAEERWDLVVSNPPHFPHQMYRDPSLVLDDPGWELHRGFYEQVGNFLNPGGSVLIQENSEGSSPEDFLPMIAAGGLSHVRTLWYSGAGTRRFYFLWVKRALPGLAFEDAPAVVTLSLRDEKTDPGAVAAARPVAFRLVNDTGRLLRPRLVNARGTWLNWVPVDLDAGAETTLAPLALRAGDYAIVEQGAGTTLARLRAS